MTPSTKTSQPPSPPAAPPLRPPANRKRWWVAIAVYATLLLIVSLVPVSPAVSVRHLDKVVHLCEYLLFAWLLVQGLRADRAPDRKTLLWAWIDATSYGILIEFLQSFMPWRSAEVADALANTLGAALGVWLARRLPRHFNVRP